MLKVNFKKVRDNAKTPYRADVGSAGYDLSVAKYELNEDGTICTVYTGIAVEIPKGYGGFLFPRSSVYKYGLQLANSVGVIDSSYRGEIIAKFIANKNSKFYQEAERCCQLVILPVADVDFEEVTELSDTSRGAGGFGSSGK